MWIYQRQNSKSIYIMLKNVNKKNKKYFARLIQFIYLSKHLKQIS